MLAILTTLWLGAASGLSHSSAAGQIAAINAQADSSRREADTAALAAVSAPVPVPVPEHDPPLRFTLVEPQFRRGEKVLYYESFERYGSTAALKAAYEHLNERQGTLNLDAESAASGRKALRIDWQDNSKGPCKDGWVLLEQKLAPNAEHREILISYDFKFERGYLFAWPKGTLCRNKGGVTSKEMIFFRNGSNDDGRITLNISGAASGGTPNIYGALKEQLWGFTIAAGRGAERPNTKSRKSYIRQHLALGGSGPDKRPSALRDGRWHRLTLRWVKESRVDAGDGTIQMWIDGVPIMDYQGSAPGHPAFGKVFTHTTELGIMQYQSVLNRGAPQAQSRWYDEVRVWLPKSVDAP